jgi:L-ascorbate metabolism protein UlaG (beta-lactamase superfamily)
MGFLLKANGSVLYHAGDTDFIPEMQKLTGFGQKGNFIALLPVSGKFVMNHEDAVEAAALIKPTLAIPIGFGMDSGSVEDAQEFVRLCEENGIKAMMPEK